MLMHLCIICKIPAITTTCKLKDGIYGELCIDCAETQSTSRSRSFTCRIKKILDKHDSTPCYSKMNDQQTNPFKDIGYK